MLKRLLFVIGLCGCLFLQAQVPCDSVQARVHDWSVRLSKLNYEDPEILSLHYLYLQDIRNEMQQFRNNDLLKLVNCQQLDYYQVQALFNKVSYRAESLQLILGERRDNVDYIFYQKACEDLLYADTANALYHLDRALQYNLLQPEALLLRSKLMLAQQQYQESVNLIHKLYTEVALNDDQERAVSDFTLELYDKLYNRGNALVKSGHAADALELFLALEHFCSNMPSGYCNDDYYRGILLSREGVYESYISIAKEAERRHNMEMARKFYRYAEEYRTKKQEE